MSAPADYPLAIFVPAASSNYRRGRARKIRRVVIHITDGRANAWPVAQMFQEHLDKPRSSHFIVGQDTTVLQSVRLADTAWHAGTANPDSIGIENCARSPKELGPADLGLKPTLGQYQRCAELVVWCLKTYGIPCDREHVLGHAEADPKTTHKDCPTGAWDWAVFWPMVVDQYNGAAA